MCGRLRHEEHVMSQIQCNNQYATSPWSRPTSKPLSQTAQVTSNQTVLALERQDVKLSLTTKEGDTVNISFAANSKADYQDNIEYGQGKGVESTKYSASTQQYFSMTVDGNLNKQERSEVDTVLKTIDQMLNNFVNGRLEPTMAQANKLTDLETVDNLSVKMSFSRAVMVTQHTEVQAGADPLGITYDGQGQLVPTSQSGASPAVASAHNQVTAAADDLTTAMARQLARVRDVADHPFDTVRQIFDKYRQQLKNLNADNAFGPALIDRMHNNLLAKMLQAQTDPTPEAQAATSRAGLNTYSN
jgi:hypothetical protein